MRKFFLFAALICAVPLITGCGGGAGGSLSGPNSNTEKGLGTVIVTVTNGGDTSIVTLGEIVRPTRDGQAKFYNVTPGSYYVEARTQAIGLPGESRKIKVMADKTLKLTLSLSAIPADAEAKTSN